MNMIKSYVVQGYHYSLKKTEMKIRDMSQKISLTSTSKTLQDNTVVEEDDLFANYDSILAQYSD